MRLHARNVAAHRHCYLVAGAELLDLLISSMDHAKQSEGRAGSGSFLLGCGLGEQMQWENTKQRDRRRRRVRATVSFRLVWGLGPLRRASYCDLTGLTAMDQRFWRLDLARLTKNRRTCVLGELVVEPCCMAIRYRVACGWGLVLSHIYLLCINRFSLIVAWYTI